MFNSIQLNSIKALIVLLIISLSSCEKHTEEILSDAKVSEAKLENKGAAPSFEGVQLEAVTPSNARGEERRFLSFNTPEAFEKAMASLSSGNIEEWEKHFGFESSRKTKDTETLAEEGIEDEYLAAVLSPENVIQIGKWAFRIDVRNERVAVVEADSKEKVARLFDINYKTQLDENFMWFSTDDDILPALEAGSKGTISKGDKAEIWGWVCRDRRADREKDEYDFEYFGNANRLKTKAVYQKAGVYFSIIMKAKIQWNQFNNGIWVDANPNSHLLESDFNYNYKVRCGNSYSSVDSYDPSTFRVNSGRKLDHRVYESMTSLKNYYASVVFYVRSYNGSTFDIQVSRRLTIQD